jgi:peptidoglycan/LPS O-acetylase OafA/YrhL
MTYWVTVGRLPLWMLVAAVAGASLAATLRHADWFATAMATAGLILYAHRRGAMHAWLAGPIAQFFGRTSYSLYLFHPLIGWTAMSVALLRFNEWIALCVGLAASVISAWVAYLVVEKPSIALSRRVRIPERAHTKVSLENPAIAVETK